MADYEKLLPPPLSVDVSFSELAKLANDWPEINVDLVRTLAHIEHADPVLLQHYAEWFSLSNEPAWTHAVDENARRLLAAGAVMLHRLKGTPWAVKRVLELIGMGAGTRLTEGGVQRLHDGTVYHDGRRKHGGAAWAEYSIEADLGENAGLDAGTGDLIQKVLAGIAPARCHLTDIIYRADVKDTVVSSDIAALTVEPAFLDMPSRPRHDGSWKRDSAIALFHDGAIRADGSSTHSGWRLKSNPHRHGPEDSVLHTEIAAVLSDKVERFHLRNGTRRADGSLDHGATRPACIDSAMTVYVTRFSPAGQTITSLEVA